MVFEVLLDICVRIVRARSRHELSKTLAVPTGLTLLSGALPAIL